MKKSAFCKEGRAAATTLTQDGCTLARVLQLSKRQFIQSYSLTISGPGPSLTGGLLFFTPSGLTAYYKSNPRVDVRQAAWDCLRSK